MVNRSVMDPHVREVPWAEPLEVFRAAQGHAGLVWLDSGGPPRAPSRWSILALDPCEVLEVRVGAGRLSAGSPDPFRALENLHDRWRVAEAGPARVDAPPAGAGRNPIPPGVFTGGVIALVGYDAGRALEKIPVLAADDPALPDLWAGVYDATLVFDRAERRAYVTHRGDGTPEPRVRLLGDLAREAAAGTRAAPSRNGRSERGAGRTPAPSFDAGAGYEGFLAGVARIRDEIARGEIYQANLTRRIVAKAALGEAPALYERLRTASPTPFGAYVDAGTFRLLSASPERFLSLCGGIVETRPIKGTRPRGRSADEDDALRGELLASEKDAAELLMIVDLERNDLGRVGDTGSVAVEGFPTVEGYSTVWHLVATVRARVRAGVTPTDVLRAAFPGGSITGAPKLRAMEILETLEPGRRKFSMGSLVAWDLGGNLDSSILIRTLTLRAGEAILDVGAGIVADSSPEAEFRETLAKAAPLVDALGGA
jgi:para-aminobenzoate synthetase component 1